MPCNAQSQVRPDKALNPKNSFLLNDAGLIFHARYETDNQYRLRQNIQMQSYRVPDNPDDANVKDCGIALLHPRL